MSQLGTEEISAKAQRIYAELYDDGPLTTTELSDRHDIENNNTVIYHIDEHIDERHIQRSEKDVGAPVPATVFDLTDVGKEYVEHMRGGFEVESTRALDKQIEELQGTVESLENRLQKFEGKSGYVEKLKADLEDTLNEIDRTIGSGKELQKEIRRVKGWRDAATEAKRESEEAKREAKSMVEDLEEERKRLEDVELNQARRLQGIEDDMSSLKRDVNGLQDDVENVQEQVVENYKEIHSSDSVLKGIRSWRPEANWDRLSHIGLLQNFLPSFSTLRRVVKWFVLLVIGAVVLFILGAAVYWSVEILELYQSASLQISIL